MEVLTFWVFLLITKKSKSFYKYLSHETKFMKGNSVDKTTIWVRNLERPILEKYCGSVSSFLYHLLKNNQLCFKMRTGKAHLSSAWSLYKFSHTLRSICETFVAFYKLCCSQKSLWILSNFKFCIQIKKICTGTAKRSTLKSRKTMFKTGDAEKIRVPFKFKK